MAQYESEARVPKIDLVKQMSQIFDVNSPALTVPDIDTYAGLMHTLFALEDMYGLNQCNPPASADEGTIQSYNLLPDRKSVV